MYKIASVQKEINWKEKEKVVLYSSRFRNKQATIKSLDKVNEIAIVITADGQTSRVDFSEMLPENDMDLTQMQSVKQEEEYRPVGNGNGKTRDSFRSLGSAFKKIEKQMGKMRIPITAIRYMATEIDKWNNGVNAMWEGNVKFNVDFMDINGQKHSATVQVPIKAGLVHDAEYIIDGMNRKYAMSKEGIQNFLQQMNWVTENDIQGKDSVFALPGQELSLSYKKRIGITKKAFDTKFVDLLHKADLKEDSPSIKANIDTKSSKVDYRERIITAQNPHHIVKKIMSDELDQQEFRKLFELRDIVKQEIEQQESFNEARGFAKSQGVNYKRLNKITEDIFKILDKYSASAYDYFNPAEAKRTIDKVLKKISDNPSKDHSTNDKMDNERTDDKEVSPGKKKQTQHKRRGKDVQLDTYERHDSPVPASGGDREFNDMSPTDPKEVRFSR